MKKVLAFGAFDPLHEGHKDFLRQAKELGDHLTIVVARDSSIKAIKGYDPHESEEARQQKVAEVEYVDEALLGNEGAHHYQIFSDATFDIVALGYDQRPENEVVREKLNERGKYKVEIVRLAPFHPEKYKSTYIRRDSTN